MPFLILSILVQVAFVVHIVKTGRSTTWIWIVIMLPLAGSIAYFIVEVMPELAGSRTGRKAARNISKKLNPDKELKAALREFSISDSIENAHRLAEALKEKGMNAEAKELYLKCLTGIHKTDPGLMSSLAEAEFALGNFMECCRVLDDLISANPTFKSANSHLLYARALEEAGESEKARHEYESLIQYFPGPEPAYRLAQLLRRQGSLNQAETLLKDILVKSETFGRHYVSQHKDWIKLAKDELQK